MRCAPGRRRFQRCKSRICPVILSEKLGEDVEVRLNEDVKQPYLTIVVRNTEEVNGLAINSGMICDGAKASCAAKIASSVEAGLLGMYMYKNGSQFRGGDGILAKGVEKTIHNINILAREGMRKTDDEIIKIMLSHSYLENKL